MAIKLIVFLLYFIALFTIVYSSSLDPVNNPKFWTVDELYQSLKYSLLNPNHPNYAQNIKYLIHDPEFYLAHADLREAYNGMYTLYDKYNISTHVFFISGMNEKYKIDEAYANFVNKLSYIMYKDNELYNEEKTITAVFFIKDRKMRIRTTRELREILTDDDALDILNRRKKDLKGNNFQEVANGLIKDILSTYQRNLMYKNNNSEMLLYTILFIIGVSIFIFLLSREQPSKNEDKVKVFLDKLKSRENPKEIFAESCIICLEDFLSNEKIKELEKSGNKEQFEKEETSILECGHKFHRKCIADWFKKQQNCPTCRMKVDIKGDEGSSSKSNGGVGNININFANILTEVLRIQSDINILNEREVNRIMRSYHPRYRTDSSSSYSSHTSHNKSFSSHNKGSGGATSGW
jgi:hypothetical protein